MGKTVTRKAHTRNGNYVRAHKVRVATGSGAHRSPRRGTRETLQDAAEVGIFGLFGTVLTWSLRAALGITLAVVVGTTVAAFGLTVWLLTDKKRRRRRSWWAKRKARRRRIRRARVANFKQGTRDTAKRAIGGLVRWRK